LKRNTSLKPGLNSRIAVYLITGFESFTSNQGIPFDLFLAWSSTLSVL